MNDYSELTVQIEPLSRMLYEQMSRQEWLDAERTADKLSDIVNEIRRRALSKVVQSGVGYVYEGV
jgi:hypothetical protein